MENKSKNIVIILLALVVVILAVFIILNKNNKEKIVDEEVRGEIVLADLEEKIKTEAPEWSSYWIKENTESNLSMFVKSGERIQIEDTEYPYDATANKLRAENIYVYSPDKTKILDPKGGMELFEKDGKIQEAYDVDSSVKLINLTTNKFKQILTCGTPCGFSDAVWVDDNSFVVLGQSRGSKKVDECKIYNECQAPLLYVFDLGKDEYSLYQGPERLLVTEKEEVSTVKNTYTYKNHGFTMELPKGFIPTETPSGNEPIIYIDFMDGQSITYFKDVSWWRKYILPNYGYLGESKIGNAIFKEYAYTNDKSLYWYEKGNVGYEFYGNKDMLNTFKFVGWN
jgi:hypothetical protein